MSLLMQALKSAEPAPAEQPDTVVKPGIPDLFMVELDGIEMSAADRADMFELAFEQEALDVPNAGAEAPVQHNDDNAAARAAEEWLRNTSGRNDGAERDGPAPPATPEASASGLRGAHAPYRPMQPGPDTGSVPGEQQADAAIARHQGAATLHEGRRTGRAMLVAGVIGVALALAAGLGYVYVLILAEDDGPLSPVVQPALAPVAAVAPASDAWFAAAGAQPGAADNVSGTLSGAMPQPAAGAELPPASLPAPLPASRPKSHSVSKPPGTTVTARAPAQGERIDIVVGATAVLDPALGNAYRAYQAGDMAGARRQYQQTLTRDAANRDALLGLAAIAVREQHAAQARAYYVQLLELDPSDPDAIGGLSSLQQADPVQHESHLKKVLVRHPNAGAVLFAMGNLYAQERRWAEAQQAYFRAFANAPANPDYALNLAVSLDRLGQVRLALDFYGRALVLADQAPGNFATAGVRERIRELELGAPPR